MLFQNISRLETLTLLNIWLTADLGLSDFSDRFGISQSEMIRRNNEFRFGPIQDENSSKEAACFAALLRSCITFILVIRLSRLRGWYRPTARSLVGIIRFHSRAHSGLPSST
jgi:hypothetical protein